MPAREGSLPRLTGGAGGKTVHIVQGEQHISADPAVVIQTLLGSCVSACLRDPLAGIGGMNHFLLPGDLSGKRGGDAERHAVHAMELLVNALLVKGAARNRLEAKVFGGSATMKGLTDIGVLNGEFAVRFLAQEGISIVGQCLGGVSGRRIQYWPVSGRARRSFIDGSAVVAPVLRPVAPVAAPDAGALELF